ncbi:MAG: hypothetical protein WC346_18425 [Methanogenium sp.]|jgi:hypothetical protein
MSILKVNIESVDDKSEEIIADIRYRMTIKISSIEAIETAKELLESYTKEFENRRTYLLSQIEGAEANRDSSEHLIQMLYKDYHKHLNELKKAREVQCKLQHSRNRTW